MTAFAGSEAAFDALFAGAPVRFATGSGIGTGGPSQVERWTGDARGDDLALLVGCEPPLLDLGCGPGRIVAALAERGLPALGVDLSGVAVGLARRRGGSVLRRDLDDPLPGEGRWGTVLLLDGNVGIGDDPATLLRRCRSLVRPGGRVVVEVSADDPWLDSSTELEVAGTPFPVPWALVGAVACVRYAVAAGLLPTGVRECARRVVVSLALPT